MFGGINSNDTPINALLQFLALPPLFVAILSLSTAREELSSPTRLALTLLTAGLILSLLQLVPLPQVERSLDRRRCYSHNTRFLVLD